MIFLSLLSLDVSLDLHSLATNLGDAVFGNKKSTLAESGKYRQTKVVLLEMQLGFLKMFVELV